MRYLISISAITMALSLSAPAAAQPQHGDITLLGTTTLTGSTGICDVTGWTDPYTGREYAIVGNWGLPYFPPSRVWIVDVTDPTTPTEVTYIDGVNGFDVKAYDHYVYTCDGNYGNPSRIIDIANPQAPVLLPTQFTGTHNISISDDGFLFQEVSGFSIWDLSANPQVPNMRWHAGNNNGHDSTPVPGQRVWDFGGYDGFAKLWDYSDPDTLTTMCTVAWPSINYFHSGDETDDRNYLYVCDELATGTQPDIYVFDVSNYQTPGLVTSIHDPNATVHNLYIIGNLAFVSHYNSGFKTLDLSNPAAPTVADAYDTNVLTGDGYDGAFGVDPFLPSGIVLVSDWDNGLFVFSVEGHDGQGTSTNANSPVNAGATLHQNFPNPFNPTTTITYELLRPASVTLSVYDVRGSQVTTLASGTRNAGLHSATWNGIDATGAPVASGVYYYRLEVGSTTTTKKMVLLK